MSTRLASLAALALDNVAAHARAYAIAAAPLLAALTPWLAGAAVGEGLRREAQSAAERGPDVLVSAREFGRAVPLPAQSDAALAALAAEPGVTRIERRLVAAVATSDVAAPGASAASAAAELLLLVAVEPARLAGADGLAAGSAPRAPGQCVVGAALAEERGLRPGSRLALDARRTQVFEVSGVLGAADALAGSRALVISLADAAELFEDPRSSELCVWTAPGRAAQIARDFVLRIPNATATTKDEVLARIDAAEGRRGGALALFLGPLCLLAAASFAALCWSLQARRAGEVASYKLAGFSGGDVALVATLESLVVAFFLALGSLALAWFWVRVLDSVVLATFLVPDAPAVGSFVPPAAFDAPQVLLALAATPGVTISAAVLASWRLSLARPRLAFA